MNKYTQYMYTFKQLQRSLSIYKLLFFVVLTVSICSLVFSLHFSGADQASPVRLSTDPATIKVSEGLFTLTVMVNADIPVNTFAVDLHFDPNLVLVESVNYESSISNLWVYTPIYDNASGTISAVSGTTEVGGFTGSGTLFTITFRTKTSGVTRIGLTKASVLQSDGLGTPAELATMTDTVVTIVPQTVINNTLINDAQYDNSFSPLSVFDEWDLNNDKTNDFSDAGVLMQLLDTDNEQADFDKDGLVTTKDLELLLLHAQ